MALKPGSVIKTGDYLKVDDYIQSPSGLYFAIQQSDGNFVVYYGSGPADNHGPSWASGQVPGGGDFYAIQQDSNFCTCRGSDPAHTDGSLWCALSPERVEIVRAFHLADGRSLAARLEDDGNFCVYPETGPEGSRDALAVWSSGTNDPIKSIQASRIEYDSLAATFLSTRTVSLDTETVTNNSNTSQSATISGSQTVTETSGWSDALGVSVSVSETFEGGVPLVADGTVQVSASVSNTYTWNGSQSRSRTWSWSVPVTAPAHTVTSAVASVMKSTISVPYTLHGTIVFASGKTMPGHVTGTYKGANSHNLEVTFSQLDTATNATKLFVEKIPK